MDQTKTLKCPKDGGEMEEGFELYPGYASYQAKYWVRDLILNKNVGGVAVAGPAYEYKDGLITKARRCKSCGYLESYAN